MFTVLLYYKYTQIDAPEELVAQQKELCKELGLKGRILISDEGINGTIAGSKEATDMYMKVTNKESGLEDMEWKISESEEDPFPKLRVVYRPEIVTLGLKQENRDVSLKHSAKYIEPEDLKELYESEEEFIIIDARNEYEARIGTFRNALVLPIDNFREFPEAIEKLKDIKKKKVVTFCTGGIRCEKASAYLVEQGFEDVQQLHGGIHRYSDLTGGKYFDGKMYVFDGRVAIDVNHEDPNVISTCHHCDKKVAEYTNCKNSKCNKQFICCDDCKEASLSTCSDACKEVVVTLEHK